MKPMHIEVVLDLSDITGHSVAVKPLTVAEKTAKYRAAHPDRVKSANAAWLEKNREKNRQRCRNYRRRRHT